MPVVVVVVALFFFSLLRPRQRLRACLCVARSRGEASGNVWGFKQTCGGWRGGRHLDSWHSVPSHKPSLLKPSTSPSYPHSVILPLQFLLLLFLILLSGPPLGAEQKKKAATTTVAIIKLLLFVNRFSRRRVSDIFAGGSISGWKTESGAKFFQRAASARLQRQHLQQHI